MDASTRDGPIYARAISISGPGGQAQFLPYTGVTGASMTTTHSLYKTLLR